MHRLCLAALVAMAMPAAAEPPSGGGGVEREALRADARAIKLRRDADAADATMRSAHYQSVTLARRIQASEARLTRIEGQIGRLETLRRRQRASLAEKQGEISRLLAALQTLSRRPVALVLFEPQSAIAIARVSALLDAVRPVLASRTAALNAELATTRRLHARLLAAQRQLNGVKSVLAANVAALDKLQGEKRAARDRLDEEADIERLRARQLASQALDLRGLARAVEHEAGPRHPPRTVEATTTVAGRDDNYRLPASGTVNLAFGRRNSVGVQSRGLTLTTRDHAQVTAPAGGRVAYAGPFRNYGDIVIIEHDGDLLSLISGMERVDVVAGESLRTGAPIGRMGAVRPELYLELRQDGKPVDPERYAASGG